MPGHCWLCFHPLPHISTILQSRARLDSKASANHKSAVRREFLEMPLRQRIRLIRKFRRERRRRWDQPSEQDTAQDRANAREEQRRREMDGHSALPLKRPRVLTYPLSPEDEAGHRQSWDQLHLQTEPITQRTLDQSQSLLLNRLPLEVRQLIWSAAIGGYLLHIVRAENRLLAISCPENIGMELNTREHGCWGQNFDHELSEPTLYKGPTHGHPAKPANLLPLLQTCRMVYSEAIPILYGNNIFDIDHLDTLICLDRKVLPHRLAQIHTLNLTWDYLSQFEYSAPFAPFDIATWRQSCVILETRFTGLRHITVHMLNRCSWGSRGGPHRYHCTADLDTLQRITAIDRFNVYFCYWEDQCAEAVEQRGYQFTLLPDRDRPKPDAHANPYSYAYREAHRHDSGSAHLATL